MVEQLATAQLNSIFTFVVFHHSPYSVGPHGYPAGLGNGEDYLSGMPLRLLSPYLMQYGVDAVFSGHDEIWERSKVAGVEILPDGSEAFHHIHFYDVGTGGDGLRAPEPGLDNPFQEFLAYRDAPERWEEGILLGGGTHYGHLEVNIQHRGDGVWEAIMDPV